MGDGRDYDAGDEWGGERPARGPEIVATPSSAPAAPNATREGEPTWVCTGNATTTGSRELNATRGDIVPARNGAGAAFARRYFARDRSSSDCSAVATITMSNAALIRDIVLLVLGALAGLGAALRIESTLAALLPGHSRKPVSTSR